MCILNPGVKKLRTGSEESGLLLTPSVAESRMLAALLLSIGTPALPCQSIDDICTAIGTGTTLAIVAEDSLDVPGIHKIGTVLDQQPAWSDLPFIVLVNSEPGSDREASIEGLAMLGNLALIDRPIETARLTAAIRSALRSRQRQYAVRDLMASHHLNNEVVESAEEYAILNLDHLGIIVQWSPGAERLYGFHSPEIVGHPYSILFTAEDRVLGAPARELETARTLGRTDTDRWQVRKDGSTFWASGVVVLARKANGAPSRFIRITRDLTGRRLAEDRLARQAEILQASNEELRQFAYASSHDLQEPLRMVIAYSDYLRRELEGTLTPRARQLFGYILEGGQRMQSMIEGLLAYSRSLHEFDAPTVPSEPDEVFKKTLLNLERVILDKGASVTAGVLPRVMAHEVHVLQLFQNLIGNSLKYSREGVAPEIKVDAASQDTVVLFSISDNGIGIPPEYHSEVFGVFKRLHGKDYSGAGIGLAICQRIVTRYGGRIWVDSVEGSGSTFNFTLPSGDLP
jgi:PAS domain S-box-containing protein